MANNKHLTFDDRMTIEKGLSNGASCKAIGDTLNKDKSTILKEIKTHSKIAARNIYGRGRGTYNCIYSMSIFFIRFAIQKNSIDNQSTFNGDLFYRLMFNLYFR